MSAKKLVCDFKFKKVSSNGTQYRVPVLDFGKKPFNGQKFDPQVLKRAEMWRNQDAEEEVVGSA